MSLAQLESESWIQPGTPFGNPMWVAGTQVIRFGIAQVLAFCTLRRRDRKRRQRLTSTETVCFLGSKGGCSPSQERAVGRWVRTAGFIQWRGNFSLKGVGRCRKQLGKNGCLAFLFHRMLCATNQLCYLHCKDTWRVGLATWVSTKLRKWVKKKERKG